ncbi:hypothetical protein HX021_20575 [Sphingobacterium sp. N143]|uniref:hypothetical protein n=1 Tax=Sphingobacterium sp. N143 TaxID=2746727 RepID=UPI002575BD1E|nr:hypothetical protein [Sphingobacterium sp. N143]MDM1296685.1 hypothetical protein [Sphingobacterium sp. N143]
MQKIIKGIIITLMATVLYACSKDEDDTMPPTENYVQAKINGKLVQFKLNSSHQNNTNSISVVGNTADINNSNENTHIQLAIISAKAIEPTTYELEKTSTMVITYGVIKKKADGTMEQDNYVASTGSASAGDHFTVKVDKFAEGHVSGTFSGTVVGSSVVTISEGKFSVPID